MLAWIHKTERKRVELNIGALDSRKARLRNKYCYLRVLVRPIRDIGGHGYACILELVFAFETYDNP